MEEQAVYLTKSNLIRVDKNLSRNSLDWLKIFEKDASICFDIILYISNNAQKDIFNYGHIDLTHFAKAMSYSKANLQRLNHSPAQLNDKDKNTYLELKRDEKYITAFENAFYKLGRFNIPVSSTSYDKEKGETVIKTEFIQIIKEIKIHIIPNKNNNKIAYSYTTSEEFDFNLSRFFFFTDMKWIKELRKHNLLLLYFYLKNIENGKFYKFVEKDFAKLCSFAGIEMNEDDVRRSKDNLKRRKLEQMVKYLDFNFEFVKVTGKWKYGVEFTFNANKEFADNTKILEHDAPILRTAAYDFVRLKLIKFYKRKFKVNGCVDDKTFCAWFYNADLDYNKKLDIFYTCFAEIEKIEKAAAKERFFSPARDFYSQPKPK